MSGSKTLLLFLVGAATGAAVALLTAPMSGRDARRKLRKLSDDLADQASRVGPAIQEASRRAAVSGKEAFVQTMSSSSMKAPDTSHR